MQVSWIEPDQLRDLVGRLQQPTAPAKSNTVELHTLPSEAGLGARELGIDDGDLWLPEDFAGSAAAAAEVPAFPAPSEELFSEALAALAVEQVTIEPPIEEVHEIQDEAPAPPMPDQGEQLSRIREKLQAIRVRAVEAGLITQGRATEEPPIEPPPEPELAPIAEIAEESVVEPAVEEPVSLEERLRPIGSPFAVAEPDSVAPPPVETEALFHAPSGAITDRLGAFAAWTDSRFIVSNLIVVDDHGDILWGDHAQAGLVVSAMMACKAMMRSSALGASGLATVIEQPISADRVLIIVPCETSYGAVSIAFVRDRSLTEEDAAQLRAALISAVETRPPPAPPQIGSALD